VVVTHGFNSHCVTNKVNKQVEAQIRNVKGSKNNKTENQENS